jgi:aminoglycoside 3-N-acetyltransferase
MLCSATMSVAGMSKSLQHQRRWHLPPSLELLARCALQTRRRFFRKRGGGAAAPIAQGTRLQPAALADTLAEMGIHPGDILLVHSDVSALQKVGWEPLEFVDFLLDYLGTQGTLVMPTHPVLSETDGRLTYDVRRSPSSVGLLTELFRRRAGVVRSAFPYSAAAALGPQAHALTDEHIHSYAPHDEQSPYARLGELGGKSLCVGCPLVRLTILHVAEDLLRDCLGIPGFYAERRVCVRQGGKEIEVAAHVRAGWLWWYLALSRWQADMYRYNLVREAAPSGLRLAAVNADDTIAWMKSEIQRGRSLYRMAWLNRWLRLGEPLREEGMA